MGLPNLPLAVTNGARFNLTSTLGVGVHTLAPPSYSGWPASGWSPLVIGSEIIYVQNYAIHPWPISRAEEGTVEVSHAAGELCRQQVTAAVWALFAGLADQILTDADGNVLVDASGNVLTG